MAKTTSQIIAENQKKRAEAAAVGEQLSKIHQQQMAGVETRNAARTQAIIAEAIAGTIDKNRKKELEAALPSPKTPREEQIALKKAPETKKQTRDRTKKAVEDYQKNTELDWTDAAAREQYDQELQRLKRDAAQAEKEYNAEEDRKVIESDLEAITGLTEEERRQLEQYAVNQVRDQNLPIEMTGMMPNARQEAAALIGKYGQDRVDELAESYMRQENADFAQSVDEKSREFANEHGVLGSVLGSIATVPVSAVSGLVGTVGQLQGMARGTGRYATLDPNATGTIGNTFTGVVRGQVQQNIEEGLGGGFLGKAASIGYQGIMSAADSIARAFLGGGAVGGAALAATGSFSQTMAEASRQGATPAQAALLATVNSAIEAASEKIPLDNLIRTAKGTGAKSVLWNVLRQMGIEATTEEISLVGTVLAEAAVLQEKSGYKQDVIAGISSGLSQEEAIRAANRKILDEVVNTALVSAVSGGVSSLGGSYADARGLFAENQEQTNPELNKPADTQQEAQTAIENNQARQERMAAEEAQQAAPQKVISDVVADGITGNREKQVQTTPAQPQRIETAQETQREEQFQATNEATSDAKQASAHTVDTQKQSSEGGQIKGTGAAERNFSGKPAYNATISEDNAQPDRRNDVRPMELPATDINGGNVSATTGNVYGSQNTPDDLAEAMEEPVARGDFSYVRVSNDAATQRAQQAIELSGGWQEARDNFRDDVNGGKAGAELSARGALILNHAAEVYKQAKASGNTEAAAEAKREWLNILSDVRKLGTNTAQGLQALKIIRNLMPQDKLQFAQIAVQKMARDLNIGTDIKIDQRLLTDYENATTDQQRNEIMEKIQQNVADQIPSTLLDKWNALRYTNMLGNLKTNVRNIAGNVANTAVYRFKDATGAAIEAMADKVSGGKVGRTKSVVVNKQLQKACGDYYNQVKNDISSGGKYGENNAASGDFAQGVMDKRQIFKFKPLENYRKATNWMMNNQYFGDEAFGKAAFTHAMAGYLQANGVKDVKSASPELLDKAMAYAVKEAQEVTFHDNSALARIMGKLKKDMGVVGEGVIPFTKTPANVLTRAEEYSPLGIINTAIMSAQKAAGKTALNEKGGRLGEWAQKGQDITGADIINSLSKTLTGSAIFALGMIMQSQDLLNGGPDEDEEQAAFDQMNGIQPYSINMPDGTTYTMDWLTPVAMPLFMGAELMKIASEKDLTFADLEQVCTAIAEPMLQLSMLQGMNDSLESIKYSENNLGQFFINAAVNYLTQGLTNTLLGQLERSTEENRMTTYIDKDSSTPQWMQKQLGKASQKIPGWDYQQTEYVDAWGQKQKNEGGIAYELLSPGYSQTVKDDAVTQEMNRLRETTGENVFPDTADKTITYTDRRGTVHKDHNLTAEQYKTFAQTQGQTARKLWDDVVNTQDFDALTDAQKAKASAYIEAYAKETAEIAAIGDSHTGYSESWMQDVRKNGASAILRRTYTAGLNNAASGLTSAWANGYDEERFITEMETMYDSFRNSGRKMQRQIMESVESNARIYIEARKGGVSSDTALNVQRTIATAKPEGGGKNVNQKQKLDIIAKTPGMTEKQRVMMGKLYGSDAQDENIDEVATIIGIAKAEGKKTPNIDSFTLYTQLYRDHEDYTKGTGKRERTVAHWQKKYGIDYQTARSLYKAFS